MTGPPHPPRLAVWLLRRLVPAELQEAVEGDLRERYAQRRRETGRLAADAWMWRQTLWIRPFELRRVARVETGGGGATMSGGWGSDLRGVLRSVRHRPAVSLAVSATVAVAVGVTTAVFSVVNGVLLRPLDFPQPERLVAAWQTNPEWMGHPSKMLRNFAKRMPLSVPTFNDWQAATTGFESVGIVAQDTRTWQGPERAETVEALILTHGVFDALEVPAALGRTLVADDDQPGAPGVAVLSHGFWQERLGGEAEVLGTTLDLDGEQTTVIGVMPASFAVPRHENVEIWTSLPEDRKTDVRDNQSFTAIGRLKPGATVASLEADLEALQDRLSASYPDAQKDYGANVEGLLDSEVGAVRTTLWFLLGAVGFVLAIACVNIANMLSVTSLGRRRELAVRAALGAERGRLVRALLLESAGLALLGGLTGLVLAGVALPALVAALPPSLPRADHVTMDPAVLLFGILVTTATAVAVGILPALRASRVDPGRAMAEGSRSVAGSGGGRARSILVVAEVALAFSLLVGAGLLGRSYMNLWTEDRGFPTQGLAVMSVSTDVSLYETDEAQTAARKAFADELRERLRALPGVQVTGSSEVPLSGAWSYTSYDIEGADGVVSEDVDVLITAAYPDYLEVMGIPVLQGRGLEEQDLAGAPRVAVVNQALADAYWPGQSAIGRRVRHNKDEWATVVGVVGNVRHQSLEEPPEPKVYVPTAQSRREVSQWVLRSADPAAALARARDIVTDLSPTTPVRWQLILDEHIARSVALPRFRTLFVVGLAGLATILALLGVYGVVAFSVSERTREVALRMALGARRGEVVGATLGSGLRLCGGGLVLGLVIALAGSRVLESFLYDLPTLDPLTYLLVTLVVGFVGLLAGYVPARRAARVDPMTVLKSE